MLLLLLFKFAFVPAAAFIPSRECFLATAETHCCSPNLTAATCCRTLVSQQHDLPGVGSVGVARELCLMRPQDQEGHDYPGGVVQGLEDRRRVHQVYRLER
jgi:hypothetical protein